MTSDSRTGDLLPGDLAWVRRLAWRMLRDEALADDVAQDVWLAAHENAAPLLAESGGLRAWLRVVTRNRVRRLLRTDRRRAARERFAVEAAPTTAASPADVVERAELHRTTMDAVMALDEPYREALLLRHLDELDATAIAARQGVSHAAARQRLSRATQMLRERLERTHAGGFAAWSAAWSRDFFPGAATVGSAAVLTTVVTMKAIHVVSGLALLAITTWVMWPSNDVAPTVTPVVAADAAARAANSAIDREAPESTTARAAGIELRVAEVVDEASRPVADTTVLVLAEHELVRTERTDANGRIPLPAALVADELLVAARGRVPFRVARNGDAVQRIVWPTGAIVAGSVHGGDVGGVELTLEHDAVPPALADLRPRALATLAALGIAPTSLGVVVPSDGTFTFAGLSAEWSGALSAGAFAIREPSRRGAVDRGCTLVLREPATGIRLELDAPVLVTGRVVAKNVPVTGARVFVDAAMRDAPRVDTTTRDDGTFVIGLRRTSRDVPVRGSLFVSAANDASVVAMRALDCEGAAIRLDVGDIETGAPLEVNVVDEAGAPLPDAIVAVVDANGRAAEQRTDAAGAARFAATSIDAATITVEARGHARHTQKIGSERTITVTLLPSNELVVLVRDSVDRPVRGTVRVSAERLPFVVPAGAAVPEGMHGAFEQVFSLGTDGAVRLRDLVPGVMLHFVARDDGDRVIGEVAVIAPAVLRSETTTLRVESPASGAATLLVRDERGRPVPRARIHAEAGEWLADGRTDANGTFVFTGLSKEIRPTHFEVVHPACVPFVRQDVVVAPNAGPIEVVLHSGRQLVVNVRQASGAAVRASYVTIGGGPAGLATLAGPGRYVFENVARQAGELEVVLDDDRTFRQAVGATAEIAEVVVPDLASVDVALADDLSLAKGSMLHLLITPLEPGAKVARRIVRPEELQARTFALQMVPGRCRVQLESRRGRTAQAIGSPRELELTAGTTRIVLP